MDFFSHVNKLADEVCVKYVKNILMDTREKLQHLQSFYSLEAMKKQQLFP